MNLIKRPLMRYFGGKWNMADWIISHFPTHDIYVEPYLGGGSVFFRKQPSRAELINDIDSEIVSVYRVLQDDVLREKLLEKIQFTPYSREEYELSFKPVEDLVENARRVLIRSHMGFGAVATNNRTTGFRSYVNIAKRSTTPAQDWGSYPPCLQSFCMRLEGVTIENRDAISVIEKSDTASTLFYIDPPYPMSTRKGNSRNGRCYTYEMTDEDHESLLKKIIDVQGHVLLSTYENDLYNDYLEGKFISVKKQGRACGQKGTVYRIEQLWMNVKCAETVTQRGLFDG